MTMNGYDVQQEVTVSATATATVAVADAGAPDSSMQSSTSMTASHSLSSSESTKETLTLSSKQRRGHNPARFLFEDEEEEEPTHGCCRGRQCVQLLPLANNKDEPRLVPRVLSLAFAGTTTTCPPVVIRPEQSCVDCGACMACCDCNNRDEQVEVVAGLTTPTSMTSSITTTTTPRSPGGVHSIRRGRVNPESVRHLFHDTGTIPSSHILTLPMDVEIVETPKHKQQQHSNSYSSSGEQLRSSYTGSSGDAAVFCSGSGDSATQGTIRNACLRSEFLSLPKGKITQFFSLTRFLWFVSHLFQIVLSPLPTLPRAKKEPDITIDDVVLNGIMVLVVYERIPFVSYSMRPTEPLFIPRFVLPW
jgi:hypothetical protein